MSEYPKLVDVSLPCPACKKPVEFEVYYFDPECLTAPVTMECPHCGAKVINQDEQRLVLYDDLED